MIISCYILLLVYAACIGWLIYGYSKVPGYGNIDCVQRTRFSIVVPFRNEAENLPKLIESFKRLDYPPDLFEVILVDDASDVTFTIDSCRFNVIIKAASRISGSPKKDAINTAVAIARNDWIITTDADCRVPEKWLKATDHYIQQKKPEMVAGAVAYDCQNSFLHHFQQLELASLQAATVGSFGLGHPFMCNGANFAYTKSFFSELGGFNGNESIASGDDVFLLQKAAARFPERVHYLKSPYTTVVTKAAHTWRELWYQRIRWASKSVSYQGYFGKMLGLAILLGNLAWIILFCTMLSGGIPIGNFLGALLLKNGFDLMLAIRNAESNTQIRFFLPVTMLYPFFSIAVAGYALFGEYEWKGRKFKR